ncbi:MAG: hypothetical protein NCW75_02245 [Phycisphaera sp.]|nr:MAG: hypothetical protein NCW75_02245 [Phycisphaera sp.]
MARTPTIIATCCSLLALATLSGCIAARQSPEEFGTIGGVVTLPALAGQQQLDRTAPQPSTSTRDGNVLDRSRWATIALLAPSDLTLHTPHYAPARLPTTGDWRYDGTLPSELSAHEYGSGNSHQLKSLAYEPFLQVYDLVMMPVRMFTETPPNKLDASPDTTYIRAPEAWETGLPITGRPVGTVGGTVVSRPAEAREL